MYDETGLKVVERQLAGSILISKSSRHLYAPTPPSPERAQELEEVAHGLGFATLEELATTPVRKSELQNVFDPYMLRYLSDTGNVDTPTTALDAAREMRRAVLEARYSGRALQLGRQLLQAKLPRLCPEKSTLTLIDSQESAHATYEGRFGGQHLIIFRGSNITQEDIAKLDENSELARTAAHELLHQKHTEVQGLDTVIVNLPDTAPFNEGAVQDPWEVKQIRDHYWSEPRVESRVMQLRQQLSVHLMETIAYLGEAEVSGFLDTSKALHDHLPEWPGWQEAEHEWVTAFAATSPLGQRSQIIERLMRVDVKQFADMPQEQVEQLIENPLLVLEAAEISPRG